MVIVTVLVGLIIGVLVGMSGIGGAILLLPVLIIVLRVPPLIAVGSDAVFAALTKVGAATVHWRQKTVDFRLALHLAIGSLPGAVVGFSVLHYLQATYGEGIGTVMERMIGVLLLIVPFVMIGQTLLVNRRPKPAPVAEPAPARNQYSVIRTALIGLIGGLLVGLSAVGSGSIILVLLLLAFRRTPAVLVGTDIVHAVLLTGLTGTLHHFVLATVDFELVGLLLLGSLPGAYVGARMSRRISPLKLRLALLVLLVSAGLALVTGWSSTGN
jgi:uncharacterized membrane protein YfcA